MHSNSLVTLNLWLQTDSNSIFSYGTTNQLSLHNNDTDTTGWNSIISCQALNECIPVSCNTHNYIDITEISRRILMLDTPVAEKDEF